MKLNLPVSWYTKYILLIMSFFMCFCLYITVRVFAHSVLCCHSNTWCLAAFLPRAQAGRGGYNKKSQIYGGVGVRKVQVVQNQCFWATCCKAVSKCCITPSYFPFCQSLRVSLPDHIPQPVSGGPSFPHRVHFSSLTNCTTCSSLGTTAHTLWEFSLKTGDSCRHYQTCSFPQSVAFCSSFRCGCNFRFLWWKKLSRWEEVTWRCKQLTEVKHLQRLFLLEL